MMTKPTIQIGEEIREMNDNEFAQYKADKAIEMAAVQAKIKAEKDKTALLVRLGITEDELATILQ